MAAAAKATSNAAAGSTAPAAAAAGSATPAFKQLKRRLHNKDLTLKQFKVHVVYWDLHPDDFKVLHLYIQGRTSDKIALKHSAWWEKLFADNHAEEANLRQALASALEENRTAPPFPGFIVVYEKLSFIPPVGLRKKPQKRKKSRTTKDKRDDDEEEQQEDVEPEDEGQQKSKKNKDKNLRGDEEKVAALSEAPAAELNGASLIIWGPRDTLFKKAKQWGDPSSENRSWSLRKDYWAALRQDLTEQLNRPQAEPDELQGAAAAAAAATREDEEMHEAEAGAAAEEEGAIEEEEEVAVPARPAAAAAAAAAPLLRPRASKRQQSTQKVTPPEDAVSEEEDDEEDASEDEYEEEEEDAEEQEDEEEEEEKPPRKPPAKQSMHTRTAAKHATQAAQRTPAKGPPSALKTRHSTSFARR
jgi:hypothetical protein